MKHRNQGATYLSVATVSALLTLSMLCAEEPLSLSRREDRALVFAFVTMIDSLQKSTRAEGQRPSGRSLLGVTDAEFAAITSACAEAAMKLRSNHQEAVRYFDAERAAGREPSNERRAAFEERRTEILENVIGKLRRELPAQAWNSVSAFIGVEMRSSLVSRPLPGPPGRK